MNTDAYLSALSRVTRTLVWIFAPDGACERSQPSLSEFSGLDFKSLRGFGWLDCIHPDDRAEVKSLWKLYLSDQSFAEIYYRMRRHDGEYRMIHARAVPIFDAQGVLREWVGACDDITEQRRPREWANSLPNMAWECGPDGAVVWANDLFRAFVGKTGSDVPGIDWPSVYHPEDLPLMTEQWAFTVAHGLRFRREARVLRPDGTSRWFVILNEPQRDLSGRVVGWFGTATDIDDARQLVTHLRSSEARIRRFANAMPQLAYELEADGTVAWFNRRFCDYIGISYSTTEGLDWPPIYHPQDLQALSREWERCLKEHDPFLWEVRIRRHDGVYEWHLMYSLPVFDENGLIEQWFGTATNMHALKMAEQQLRENDRRKDEFIATLAHELRNPLSPLRNGVGILQTSASTETSSMRVLAMMQRQVDLLVRMVDDLLDVSRMTRGTIDLRLEDLTLTDLVNHAIETVAPQIEAAQLQLQVRTASPFLKVRGDSARLTQVFANIVGNAAKFTDPGGRVDVEIAEEQGTAVVVIRDSGIGIEPELQGQVFDTFAQVSPTSQRSRNGLGIGLSLVRSLVKLHGGVVSVHSEGLGRGSEFSVRLPALDRPMEKRSRPGPRLQNLAGHRILLVDDNRDAGESTAMLLTLSGADVRFVCDPHAALNLVDHYRPTAGIFDIGMPGMDGHELARRVRASPCGRELLLVALTGWDQDADLRASSASGFDHHFVKPVDMIELNRALMTRPPVPDG